MVGYEADGLRARISDFGLAKHVNPLTLLATAAGTLAFKPPESFSDTKGDSCAADVWAVGTTMYLLLTDEFPYSLPDDLGWNSTGLFDGEITPPSRINPDTNKALDEILLRALRKNSSERYQSARDMLKALEKWKPGADAIPNAGRVSESRISKTALGKHSAPNATAAQQMVEKAFLCKNDGRLADAADIIEEAFNKLPDLRDKYSNQVKLWRCGISM